MKLPRRELRKARIEIIPMIDTIFFLLVFFMMSSLSRVTMSAPKVVLPTSRLPGSKTTKKVVLTVDKSGAYFVDKAPTVFRSLLPQLKDRIRRDPDLVVVINADRDQQVGQVQELIDVAKQADPARLYIATEADSLPPGPLFRSHAAAWRCLRESRHGLRPQFQMKIGYFQKRGPGGERLKKLSGVYGRETKKARIEIIPMIDAIFLLLVFFMYSSLSMVKMKGMGVSIPKLSSAPASAEAKPPRRYIVTMDKQGKTFVNLDPVALDQLNATLTAALSHDPDGTIVVNVFRKRSVQELVNVMDQVNAVRTPKGEPAGVIIATKAVDAASAAE